MFNVNNPFWQFLNKMADQFLLSLLWMACSIPVVTFGASTTAFFTISMALHQDLEGSIFRDFFHQFRRNFKRATLVWLTQLAAFALVLADLRLCWMMNRTAGWFLVPLIVMIGLIFLIVSLFTWPLISHSKAALPQIWKTAALTALTYLPHGISMLLLIGIGVVIAVTIPFLGVLVPAMVCYQYARVYVWIFGKDLRVQSILEQKQDLFR